MSSQFPRFAAFFRDVTGSDPFPWQSDLAATIQRDGWPGKVAVPTGLGKTATMIMAIYELARQVAAGGRRSAPLRTFLVVDRRTVVDQADRVAGQIEAAFTDPGKTAARVVRQSLAEQFGTVDGTDQVLVCAHVHGQHRDVSWLHASHPTLVSLTSHQFVSRLLGRGYGVSSQMAPVHMGLVGVDALVLVDEPHLSMPAVSTLLAAQQQQSDRTCEMLGIPPAQTVLLGATVPPTAAPLPAGVAVVTNADREHGVAGARLTARKIVHLDHVEGDSEAAYAARILAMFDSLELGMKIGVVVNTISLARTVHSRLVRTHPNALLVTSRLRGGDREHINTLLLSDDIPDVVVATQTVEVGVDISFDYLISELAPYPSLVQRLGRLNRSAVRPEAHATVLVPSDARMRVGSTHVYETRTLEATRDLLERLADQSGPFDLSLTAQQQVAGTYSDLIETCWPTQPPVPPLIPATLHILSQTYPRPAADIDVPSFITGITDERTVDVRVAWRDDLNPEILAAAPIQQLETVSVPAPAVQAFFSGVGDVDVSDLDITRTVRLKGTRRPSRQHAVAMVEMDDEWTEISAPSDIAPGTTVVFHSAAGGYDEYGWNPSHTGPVTDLSVDILAATNQDVPITTRLVPEGSEFWEVIAETGDPEEATQYLPDDLYDLLTGDGHHALQWADTQLPNTGALLVRRAREGDTPEYGTVTLTEHLNDVADRARRNTAAIGLRPELVTTAEWAGALHDTGKRDERFQLSIGASTDVVLAKSRRPMSLAEMLEARRKATLPRGWRHEATSAVDAITDGSSDLLIHLVASHHGRSRPGFAPVDDLHVDATMVDRFYRLNDRYGPWALAYLEAVLRTADWESSRRPRPHIAGPNPVTRPQQAGTPERKIRTTTDLVGLPTGSPLDWWAAFGVLAAHTELDHDSTLHWENGYIPVIASTAPLEDAIGYAKNLITSFAGLPITNKNHTVPVHLDPASADTETLIRLGHGLETKIGKEGTQSTTFTAPWHPNNSNAWSTSVDHVKAGNWDAATIVEKDPSAWVFYPKLKIPGLSPATMASGVNTGFGVVLDRISNGVGTRFDLMVWAVVGVSLAGWAATGHHIGTVHRGRRLSVLPLPERPATLRDIAWLMQSVPALHNLWGDLPVLTADWVLTPNGKGYMYSNLRRVKARDLT